MDALTIVTDALIYSMTIHRVWKMFLRRKILNSMFGSSHSNFSIAIRN